MNDTKNKLKILFDACFHENIDVKEEARHLAKYLIEYNLIKYPKEKENEYKIELNEAEFFKKICGDLNLYSTKFEQDDIENFVKILLDKFLAMPEERNELINILKQSFSVRGVEEKLAKFLENHWFENEVVSNKILDIIWNVEIIKTLENTLNQIIKNAKDKNFIDHANQKIQLINSLLRSP